jgi:hypothetical protein
MTKSQEKIEESEVLWQYSCPKKDQWPEEHPQYAGLEPESRCEVCKERYGRLFKTKKAKTIDSASISSMHMQAIKVRYIQWHAID